MATIDLWRMTVKRYLSVAVLIACVGGCGARPDKQDTPGFKRLRGDYSYLHGELPSTHDLLSTAEFEGFQPGTPMAEILNDIHWKGNFREAAEYHGERIYAVSFRLFLEDPESVEGTMVWALFVDGKFDKFVFPPIGTEQRIGDFEKIAEAVASKAVPLTDLENRVRTTPSSTDVGLTAASSVLRPAIAASRRRDAENAPDDDIYRRNAMLRDQFNAARLRLGMTENQLSNGMKRHLAGK